MQTLSGGAQFALAQIVDPDEQMDHVAPAVGNALVLTDRRLIVVREGASFRPKSGIWVFALERDLRVRVGPARKRFIIESATGTLNVFVRSEQLAQVERLLAEVRRRVHSARGTDLWVDIERFVVRDPQVRDQGFSAGKQSGPADVRARPFVHRRRIAPFLEEHDFLIGADQPPGELHVDQPVVLTEDRQLLSHQDMQPSG